MSLDKPIYASVKLNPTMHMWQTPDLISVGHNTGHSAVPLQSARRLTKNRVPLPGVSRLVNSVRRLRTRNSFTPTHFSWTDLPRATFLFRLKRSTSNFPSDQEPSAGSKSVRKARLHFKKPIDRRAMRKPNNLDISRTNRPGLNRLRSRTKKRRPSVLKSWAKIDRQQIHDQMQRFRVPLRWTDSVASFSINTDLKEISPEICLHNLTKSIKRLQYLIEKEVEAIQFNQQEVIDYSAKLKQLDIDSQRLDSLVEYGRVEVMSGFRTTLKAIEQETSWLSHAQRKQQKTTARIESYGQRVNHNIRLATLKLNIQSAQSIEEMRLYIKDWKFRSVFLFMSFAFCILAISTLPTRQALLLLP
ncbi:hypothetical protein J3Q64DRAFT_1696550 [Phycomyces blakesleeanus]|uniref:Uncharacterized protein n=2 Tax=Phycomyces blakesleeanus TaxID=4837 RepID=A0A167NPV8_PHYB8|nr:hypothetical protein PHYBLDRAFT_143392 [Phycomyces blakesleeanus NRRL 1555(-)]OAD76418.1 hypothetical protein PHYBLDRAFT_143392 [Phycomyces blakesleeanus NRRL 1555(-)]|eukprot:XP_018294458.1 hypothetical protein PHYBLDRAFT_143392 [Phycomyces blakesleeanus NRRL 1555(-)]